MSIYATALPLDGVEEPAPILYQGSHVLPADNDARDGVLLLCQIPGHISRDGRDLSDGDRTVWPWLRLSLHGPGGDATVVLDREQVERIHAYLGDWLRSARSAAS
ncbi:hypothetical protein O7626_40530 [Micromonospora sp. WMMD1102]|uniref:hypothetical protein n=1 Tax=Micromonospora sp. WMMD1102 TaxID=3016105 RepID=UPI0024156E09|nr:hypothetical protein [Micromonospora sp. WMMD1102]MDG4792104.1 hypothetical protein [Micromonospora sp. WMMD1102]